MTRIVVIAFVGFVSLHAAPCSADSPLGAAPSPAARPSPPPEDFAENFMVRERLTPQSTAAFRHIVADARVSAQRVKNLTDDDKLRILKAARRSAAKVLDEKQLKDFDVLGWGILFYRPSPGDETPTNFFKRLHEEHSPPWYHAIP